MPNIFWDLTDKQILDGLEVVENSYPPVLVNTGPIVLTFMHDPVLRELARLWIECDRDRTYMKLAYSEEIMQIEEDELERKSHLRGPVGPSGVPGTIQKPYWHSYNIRTPTALSKKTIRFTDDSKEYRNSKLRGPRSAVLDNWKYRR